MHYTHTISLSIDSVDLDDWNCVLAGADVPYMDSRFIRAAERTLSGHAKMRYVVFHTPAGQPIAVACVYTCGVDFELLSANRRRRAVRFLKRVMPAMSNVRLTACSLPVATGDSALFLSPEADSCEVLLRLDEILCEIARDEGSRFVYVSTFSPAECQKLGPLADLGYMKCTGLPNYYGAAGFRDFEDYCAKLKSHKRYTINRSRKKFDKMGLRTVHLTGREGADRIYTDEVHELFDAVAHDKPRLERLPARFFRELAREMPDESVFTFIYKDDRVVAVAMSLCTAQSFNQLALGFDYGLNPQCDLLFNLFFEVVDYALQRNSRRIVMGQTTDTFKIQKLQAIQEPRYFFVKSLRSRLGAAVMRYCVRRMADAANDGDNSVDNPDGGELAIVKGRVAS